MNATGVPSRNTTFGPRMSLWQMTSSPAGALGSTCQPASVGRTNPS
jgi:hypothetical protein